METILPIFSLSIIPLSIRYSPNQSQIPPLPVVWIPAESLFLISAFFLLKPPVTSSLIYESLPPAVQKASIVAFFLAGDVVFKALLYIGVDLEDRAETFLNFSIVMGRIIGAWLMDVAGCVLRLQQAWSRTLCGLEDELGDDIDLESQTRTQVNTPPSYNDLSIPPRISDKKIRTREDS